MRLTLPVEKLKRCCGAYEAVAIKTVLPAPYLSETREIPAVSLERHSSFLVRFRVCPCCLEMFWSSLARLLNNDTMIHSFVVGPGPLCWKHRAEDRYVLGSKLCPMDCLDVKLKRIMPAEERRQPPNSD